MNIQALNSALSAYLSSSPWLIVLIIWSGIWKLIALWKAAKNNNLTMFIAIGVVNTAGILEIIYLAYLYFKSKKGKMMAK